MRKTYFTPDGNPVAVRKYLAAWADLTNPIEQALGWKLHAFDPSCQFIDSRGAVLTLSVAQTRDIIQALDKK